MMSSDQASWRLLSPANYNFERWIQKKSCSDYKILLMQINATVKIMEFFLLQEMDGNMENVKGEKEIWGRRGEETKGRICILRAGDGGRSLLALERSWPHLPQAFCYR
jgi:hypothetical protein